MIKEKEYTDEQIVNEVKNGNSELFSIIVKKYNQRLYRIALSYGVYDDDSEEVLQLTFISAYEKINQFRGEAKFSTWLIRILINQCLQLKRKKEQKRSMSEDKFVTNSSGDYLNPESEYMEKERKEIIESSIEQLPEKYKKVFMLKEVEGMSILETSSVLDITEVNVKVRLHRAKLMLKKIIKDTADLSTLFTFGNERCDRVSESVMKHIRKKTSYIEL